MNRTSSAAATAKPRGDNDMASPSPVAVFAAPTFAVPDFIIGGAPKCGTTSLHRILDGHPDVRIPNRELHFFDVDDPLNHGDFLWSAGANGMWPEFGPPPSPLARWYENQFEPRVAGRLLGEDSTTYLHSIMAARRIARYLPNVKLIFALRDPVVRAISQYHHLVKSGRATTGFTRALADHPVILRWSSYEEALRTYFALIPRERIHLFVLERFVADPQREVDAVLGFLGCAPSDLQGIETRYNTSRHPIHEPTYHLISRVLNLLPDRRYAAHFGNKLSAGSRLGEEARRVARRLLNAVLLRDRGSVPVPDETLAFLRANLRERNEGLAELCDFDFAAYWPTLCRDGAPPVG